MRALWIACCFLAVACAAAPGGGGSSGGSTGSAGAGASSGGTGTAAGSSSGGSSAGGASSAGAASSSGAGAGSTGAGPTGGASGGGGSSGATTGFAIPGTTYYLAPSGSDSNPGTSPNLPLQTFAKGVSKLVAGDGLVLEDGPYTRSPNGFPDVDCSAGAPNGTASAPVTITAQHERQAFLKGDGHSAVFRLVHCSHWNVIGLHVEDADADPGGSYSTMDFEHDDHLWVYRNLVARSNRCQNAHLMAFDYSDTYDLIEENELYDFHRHPIAIFGGSDFNEIRRNYANQRGYPAACPPYDVVADSGGINYGGSNNLWENDISENSGGPSNQTVGTCLWNDAGVHCSGGTPAHDDQWLGSISLDDDDGATASAHTLNVQLQNITFRDFVVVNPRSVAMYPRDADGTVIDHTSLFAPQVASGLITADQERVDGGLLGLGVDSITVTNSWIQGPGSLTGIDVDDASGGTWSWTLTRDGAAGVAQLSNKTVTNPFTGAAGFGRCYLWAPDGSAARDAGIGATVLYAIEDGGLTGQRLWDPVTGAPLFAGATVQGLNDPGEDGGSLVDIAARLHVNQGGCSFPAGY